MEQTIIDQTEDLELSINKLEKMLNENPGDLELKKDLSYAVMDRYIDGDDKFAARDKKVLKRLRQLVSELPEPMATMPRAFLLFIDKQYDMAISWLVKTALNAVEDGQLPADCLTDDISYRLGGPPDGFWEQFATALGAELPGSAAIDLLRGWANEDRPDEAAGFYKSALEKDPTYWRAAWDLGDIFYYEGNWEAAAHYYGRALEQTAAQDQESLYSDFALSLGKLRRDYDQEQSLRRCLELNPEMKDIRNRLGLCLHRQGKFEDALTVFDEAIRLGLDGSYPFRNRARTLEKLGRLDEAMEIWKSAGSKGKPAKRMEKEIARLEKMIEKKRSQISGEPVAIEPAKGDEDQPEIDDEEEEEAPPPPPTRHTKVLSVQKEELLEEQIQQLLERGDVIFGRRLKLVKMGRQYILPGGLGRIDHLAEDLTTGEFVVIELKRAESHDEVVGQISLYMARVRENLDPDQSKGVNGIICVFAASPKLRLAVKGIPGLELFEYGFSFNKIG